MVIVETSDKSMEMPGKDVVIVKKPCKSANKVFQTFYYL